MGRPRKIRPEDLAAESEVDNVALAGGNETSPEIAAFMEESDAPQDEEEGIEAAAETDHPEKDPMADAPQDSTPVWLFDAEGNRHHAMWQKTRKVFNGRIHQVGFWGHRWSREKLTFEPVGWLPVAPEDDR